MAADSGFMLHGSPHSLPTYRVALMLRLSGAGFRFRYVSFQRGIHLTPELRALSRRSQVPVLEHQGRVLVQSAAILEYPAKTLGRFGAPTRSSGRQSANGCSGMPFDLLAMADAEVVGRI